MNWSLKNLNIADLWEKGWTGKGIQIGHIDSGICPTHPTLTDSLADFAFFDKNGIHLTDNLPEDTTGHGTHMAGIVCGKPSVGNTIGVAPEATIYSAVAIEGGKTLLRLLAGLDWLLDKNIKVLLLGLGIPGNNPIFIDALDKFREKGILPIAPIGNDRYGKARFPANYPNVLGIGAVDSQGKIPNFSGSTLYSGTHQFFKPDFVAPGVDILSAHYKGGFKKRKGTSMAAAFVAGLAALLFQAQPNASPQEVEYALKNSCDPLPKSAAERYGHGLVNPLAALELLNAKCKPHEKHQQTKQTFATPITQGSR